MNRSGDLVIARDRVIGVAACSCHPERGRVEFCETSASRRTPAMPVPEHAASGSSHETPNLTAKTRSRGENQNLTTEARRQREESHSASAIFKKIILTLLAALSEIFDESAYDRFLLRTNASRSIASYRAFTCERDAAMQKKPRCC